MKNRFKYLIVALAGILFVFSACDKDKHELGDLVTPTNLSVSYVIEGVDAENPNGDGSGFVNFTASANNAITYTYDFGDGTDVKVAADGNIKYRFAINGVNTYNVTVSAVGTGGLQSTKTEPVEVFSSFEDEEALEFLTGGSSKSWYWAADQLGHAGLGPVTEDYGNLDYTWPNWWQIGAWDTDKACMYDAEFVFTKTSTGLTFEQVSGPAFVPGAYAGVIGVEGDVCHNTDVVPDLYGVKTVTFAPSSTMAAQDGGYRGTAFTLSDNGTMCWWVGKSTYDIIEVSDTQLKVRIEQDGEFAWYHTFVSVKPVQ
ncbi:MULTISPECIES: hypothetical protein [unclassified Lentimicrobium]|uniref:hypothetical protein n=1 Tax=unclassified Lentimicrobium TaxID=2677434 RepID=UPI001551B914|nr:MULTISPECIES: hypothetical protein [unclassified Lentimicrobium]NPD47507.1 hypothetical protein [Lentimicrobium sp. S6]NPD84682.1 hypothetical protein [Lentimicrobium sp. L6]